jgi:hypothetical protein
MNRRTVCSVLVFLVLNAARPAFGMGPEEKVALGTTAGMAAGALAGAGLGYPIYKLSHKEEIFLLSPALAVAGSFIGAKAARDKLSNPSGISVSRSAGGAILGTLIIGGLGVFDAASNPTGSTADGIITVLAYAATGAYFGAWLGAQRADIPLATLRF